MLPTARCEIFSDEPFGRGREVPVFVKEDMEKSV